MVRAGCIYYVQDEQVSMPPEDKRSWHNSRTVIVVNSPEHCADECWPIVMVCPVSSGDKGSPHDVKVGAGIGGLRKKGYIRVALMQPIDKRHLRDSVSLNPVPPDVMDEVHLRIMAYLRGAGG